MSAPIRRFSTLLNPPRCSILFCFATVVLTSRCSEGEKVTIKAHGGVIDIEGIVVAKVNDKLQIESLEVFFDPLGMFRQMAPDGKTGVVKEKVAV